MIIEIPDDNSIVRWRYKDNEDWKSAEISDLIKAYDRPQGEQIAWEQGYECGKNEIRPQGEWIEIERQGRTGDGRVFTFTIIVCSNCGEQYDLEGEKFCPHCGADMRGKEE